jgi:hypothetical protein
MSDPIPLLQVLTALREELRLASEAAQKEDLQFELGPVGVELNTVVIREKTGNAKLSLAVLGWGAGGEGSLANTDQTSQKLTFTLTPVRRLSDGEIDRRPIDVASKRARR